MISVFQYTRTNKANKPQPLKLISGINFKVKQTACEMWNLIRLLPLMIGERIDENDEVCKCYIKFVILVERLSASSFSDSDLVLHLLEIEFFLSYLENFPDVNLKRKAHFLRHYSYMIRRFGPLIKTLRFELKQQYFKSLSHLTKNRKNICQLLAKWHQFFMYLHYAKDCFLDHESRHITNSIETAPEALDYLEKVAADTQISPHINELLTRGSGVLF